MDKVKMVGHPGFDAVEFGDLGPLHTGSTDRNCEHNGARSMTANDLLVG